MPSHESSAFASLAPLAAVLDVPPRAAFERIAAAGFRFVQLSAAQPGLRPRELGGSARRDLLGALRAQGLRLAGIELFVPVADLRSEAHVDRAVARILEAVELAADLGGVPLSLALDPKQHSVTQRVEQEARRFGVRAADHALHGEEIPQLDRGIDPAAVLAGGRDPSAEALAAGRRLAAARVCDLKQEGDRGPLGDGRAGRLDVTAYRTALEIVRGESEAPVVIDARRWTDPWGGTLSTARAWAAAMPALPAG